MGVVGTAQVAGYEQTRDRPAPGPYPIFRCRDGHVRVVLLAPRQWHAMRAWLGEPDLEAEEGGVQDIAVLGLDRGWDRQPVNVAVLVLARAFAIGADPAE